MRKYREIGITLIWIGLSALPAHAIDKHWNVASGNWATSGNWSPAGVPTSNDIVYVDRFSGGPGFVNINTDDADPVSIHISNDNVVRVNTFGVTAAGGDYIIGFQGTHGTLNHTSSNPGIVSYFGRVNVGNTMRIGMLSGVGSCNQNDGIATITQRLRVADSNNLGKFTANGTYNLSGVGQLDAARLEVGYGSTTFGQFPNMQGTFNLSGSAVLNVALGAQAQDIFIGGFGSHGVFNQTGGTFNSPFRFIDIARNGGTGVYNYSGGNFSVPGVAFSNSGATFNYLAGPSLNMGQVNMTNGRINVASGGGKLLRSRLLFTNGGLGNWIIDLNDNAAIIGTTLGESVPTSLFRGFNNGAWNGTGIRSTTAANAPFLTRALGFGQASDFGITEFMGQAVDPTDWVIKYTRMGDANLDGVVNLNDFNRLAANFGGSGKIWATADFNFDGIVSLHDFNLMSANFGFSAGPNGPTPEDWSALAAAVPEPSTMGLLFAALPLVRRRRR